MNLNRHGIKLTASWDPTSLNLTIKVTAKSVFVSCGRIENELRKLIGQVGELGSNRFVWDFDEII